MQEINTKKPTDEVRELLKKWPRFYFLVVYIFGPAYLGWMSPRHFLQRYFPESRDTKNIYNLGSGPRTIRKDIINVDATHYDGVAIVASLESLSIDSESADGIICDNVLEHVEDPRKAVAEMRRILKVGGIGYISTPFLYPFHSSPSDYMRWTDEGLRLLFKDFEIVALGARSGYFSSLTVVLCYGLPAIFSFGSKKLYWFLADVSLLLFFPLKFLDSIAARLPFAPHTASVLYCVIRKPHA